MAYGRFPSLTPGPNAAIPIPIPPAAPPQVYRAPAVSFDGSTVLQSVIRGVTSPYFSFAGWFDSIWYGRNIGGNPLSQYAFLIDPLGNFTPYLAGKFFQADQSGNRQWVSVGVSPPQGTCIAGTTIADLTDPANTFPGSLESLDQGHGFCMGTGDPTYEDQYTGATDPTNNTEIDFNVTGLEITQMTNQEPANPGAWQHIMGTFDLSSGQAVMAFGDSQITFSFRPSASLTVDNLTIYVGGDNGTPNPNNYIGGMADLFIYPNLSFIVNGQIPTGVRRFFINKGGFPVDPLGTDGPLQGIFVNNQAVFPSILLHGNRFTFPINPNGFSGRGFATIAGALTNSLTSPSDGFA